MPGVVLQTTWDRFERFINMAGKVVHLKDQVDKAEIQIGNIKFEADEQTVTITVEEFEDPTPP